MECPDCRHETLAFRVPETLRDTLPGDEPGAALCPHCLDLSPVDDPPAALPDFGRVSEAFPTHADAAVPMAMLVGLVSNLALYRSEISTLLTRVERAGTDPLLVLDRLAHDPSIEAEPDLERRRRQLEQLL
jgi:hypothetical protein